MLPFSPLAILPLLISTPEWPLSGSERSELGGVVIAAHTIASPVPVTLNLYSSGVKVASVDAGLFGQFSLTAPAGDYRLHVNIGGREVHSERVQLRPGSWSYDIDVRGPHAPPSPAAPVAELCGSVLGRNGTGVSAGLVAYTADRCLAGARSDPRGQYCLTAQPGTYWIAASAAGTEVGYARVQLPPASVHRDLQSDVEVLKLPPVQVTARSTAGRARASADPGNVQRRGG